MKFIINIEKKHFYLLTVMISVLGIFTVFSAAVFNPNAPTHPLEQIVAGGISVDADGDGKIDNANNLQGLSASAFCKSNGVDCIWNTSVSDIYYNTGNVGIGMTSPTEKLDVAGNIKGTGLCIGTDCITSWPIPGISTVTTWKSAEIGSTSTLFLGAHGFCALGKFQKRSSASSSGSASCEILGDQTGWSLRAWRDHSHTNSKCVAICFNITN